MKAKKILLGILAMGMVLSGCNMNNKTKGGLIGGAGGGALGAGLGAAIGALINGSSGAKMGAAIGAGVGAAGGTTAGILIGKKMDKAKKEAEAIANAQVSDAVDANGYQAVKVTFDSGILFQSGKSVLSATAQSSLTQFATNVLGKNADMNVGIVGFTDNDPWKGKTAEQSIAANQKLSEERAEAVSNFLQKHGAAANQIKEVVGLGESNPVADNSTAAGKQQNRRVEVYLYASQEMIDAAKEGTLK